MCISGPIELQIYLIFILLIIKIYKNGLAEEDVITIVNTVKNDDLLKINSYVFVIYKLSSGDFRGI
jgi:hypothetical protein